MAKKPKFAYYIGIDGGGTNCRARLNNSDGKNIGSGESGPTNIRLGIDNAWKQINSAISLCLKQAGLGEEVLSNTSVGMGLAGISSLEDIEQFSQFAPKFGALHLTSDAHIACLGAFGGENGAILISGTGSIGYALIDGRPHSIGGWGFELSDEGSAAALGRSALRTSLAAYDKIDPSSELTEAMMRKFGGHPVDIVKWVNTAKPKDYGALAPMVLDYAENGDAVAVQLATNIAIDLGRIIARLHELGAPKICLFGGMAQRLRPWLAPWTASLLTKPKSDALSGALLLAHGAPDGFSHTIRDPFKEAKWLKSKMYSEAKSAGTQVKVFIKENSDGLKNLASFLREFKPNHIVTIGRGSSDHAATYAKYLIETKIGIPTVSAAPSTSSLFSSKLQESRAVCIVISQSGKSSDLLASVEAYKKSGAKIIAFVNDENSPLFEMADFSFGLKAGKEISVAATKSFIASLVASAILVAHWGEDSEMLAQIKNLPAQIENAFALDWFKVNECLKNANSLFVLGRGYSLSIAQEAALKFKETCGLHAEAFSSAEVKHGPKAIIKKNFPILGFATSDSAGYDLINVADEFCEIGAKVFVAKSAALNGVCFEPLETIDTRPELQPILMISAFYKMACQLSILRGFNPDEPPHLQKVTDTL